LFSKRAIDMKGGMGGMECRDPKGCGERARNWEFKQKRQILIAENELESFRQSLVDGNGVLTFKKHANKREYERAFSKMNILEAVQDGWTIERTFHAGQVKIIIMYYIRTSQRSYRPVHVVCSFQEDCPQRWTVITVYDPRTKPWKWGENFQKRVCFCK
jgi:hypothetical protein